LRALGRGPQFRAADVRSPTDQIRGYADSDVARRYRYVRRTREYGIQLFRLHAEQDPKHPLALLQLGC
jgi:hypothetical protein